MNEAVSAAFTLGEGTTGQPWCFTNHGSYGAVPLPVARARREVLERVERNPDIWFRVESFEMMEKSINEAAKFVGVETKDMSFVINATEGVHCALTSLEREGLLGPHSGILTLSLAYGAVKNAVCDLGQRTKTPIEEVAVPIPLHSMKDLLGLVSERLKACPYINVAVLDHITSKTALLLPLEKLVEICRQHNVRVVVDGAHGVGQISDLNLNNINADYYVSNFHKWAFAPKGTAFLYCHPRHQPSLHPPLVSWCFRETDWKKRFGMQGTRDLSGFVAVSSALSFIQEVGVEKACHYRRTLRDTAIALLVSMWWGPQACIEDMLIAPLEASAPCMVVIKTPIKDNTTANDAFHRGNTLKITLGDSPLSQRLFQKLYTEDRVILPLSSFEGYIYCRISVQIYNTRRDYERVGTAILELARTRSSL